MRFLIAGGLVLIISAIVPETDAGAAGLIGLALLLLMWVGWRKVGAGMRWRLAYVSGGALIAASFATARLLGDISRIALYVGFALIASSIMVPMVLEFVQAISASRKRTKLQRAIYGVPPTPRATHLPIVVIALALALLHGLDRALWHTEPHGAMVLAIVVVVAAATVVAYLRIGTQARSTTTGALAVLGVLAVTREHIVPFLTGSVEPIDYSGAGVFVGALLLLYVSERNRVASKFPLGAHRPMPASSRPGAWRS